MHHRQGRITTKSGDAGRHRVVQRTSTALLAILLVCLASGAEADVVGLAWDANPESNVAGYLLYYGTSSRNYTGSIDVGNRTDYQFVEPQPGQPYFFAIQAYNTSGYGGGLSAEVSSTQLTVANFDGDARSDIGTFRPSDGHWRVRQSSGEVVDIQWGGPGDIPIAGDVDGDGRSDLVVYRPSGGYWFVLQSSDQYDPAKARVYHWGGEGDIPLLADFDGDHLADFAVFRPSNGYWYILYSGRWTTSAVQWGGPGDIPLVADFDGDRRADLVVFRPSEGRWYYSLAAAGYGPTGWGSFQWGTNGDQSLVGDFDGDGRSDLAIFRPSTSEWFLWTTSGTVFPGHIVVLRWGGPGDQPLVGDFDGDGRTDIAVFRPSDNNWYVLFSGARFTTVAVIPWGGYGDVPIIH